MRKIKFKTEYVPLSDDAISRHKNFDQLMVAYAAAPKPNWFKQFIQKKWTMFGGGLFTGAVITSALWYSYNAQEIKIPVEKVVNYVSETENRPDDISTANTKVAEIDTQEKMQSPVAADDAVAEQLNNNKTATYDKAMTHESSESANGPDNGSNGSIDQPARATASTGKFSSAMKDASVSVEDESIAGKTANEVAEKSQMKGNSEEVTENILPATTSSFIVTTEKGELPEEETKLIPPTEKTVVIGPAEYDPSAEIASTMSSSTIQETEQQDKKILPETAAGAAMLSAPSISFNKAPADEKKMAGKSKDEGKAEAESGAFSLQKFNPFHRDSSEQSLKADGRSGWFLFGRDSSKKETADQHLTADSSVTGTKYSEDVSDDSSYIQRYAQVSFITPMSSNGMDGYKYKHYISLNILQGYNGALEGAEFGGLINGLKGYATGAQFAGLGNYIGGNLKGAQFAGLGNFAGGDVKGAQFGGLANIGASVNGAQFGGITNISRSYVTGFQAAGIVNLAVDSLYGAQVAGIVNMQSSAGKSAAWQIAGIGNISLGQNSGGQIGGVFNVAGRLNGGQIGLINFGKNIKGFQIGLINVSDSIDGPAIGLISVSSDGIFDVNAWSSDFLTFNGGIRVGTRNIYNIYAYGISPFNADLPFGFGAGIGGHIPLKKFFVDIDGMAWSMHRSYISFERINMINTFRVMGGYTFSRYFSVFAGPTLNVSVQDNYYEPFLSNYFYESINANNTVRIAPGFVVGVRLF